MVRAFILILAVLEVALGAFALVATVLLVTSHPAGLNVLPLPVMTMTVLLLAASAALFVRRPWSYYAHIAIIVLLGVIFALSGGALLGMDAGQAALLAGVIVIALTAAFLARPVRRHFGLGEIGVS